jgi:dihydrodipicolinate synthase/N-acetylneuraminate lyase
VSAFRVTLSSWGGRERDRGQGLCVVFPTAFTADGTIDVDAQRRLVRLAIEHGAHGIICFGLTERWAASLRTSGEG